MSVSRPTGDLAQRIIDQVTHQTADCLLEAAFAEDPALRDEDPGALARHVLTRLGIAGHRGVVQTTLRLGVPVIGLGASAPRTTVRSARSLAPR